MMKKIVQNKSPKSYNTKKKYIFPRNDNYR